MQAEVRTLSYSEPEFSQSDILPNEVEISWLGQAGFIIRNSEISLVIDPYLSDSLAKKYAGREFSHKRMHEAPLTPEQLADLHIDYLLSTHDHTDHLDPDTLKPVYTSDGHLPLCIAPRYAAQVVSERGVPPERTVLVDAGERFSTTTLQIDVLASAHEDFVVDSFGNNRFLGYVITVGDFRIYHSGDGVPYDGLIDLLRPMEIDIGLFPVNGRDAYRAERGVPGNFTAREASRIIREAGIGFLIPHHFGMFEFNTEHPEVIRNVLKEEGFAEQVDWCLPRIDRKVTFST
jgi:L-ascorbate metabolism protein UlaG (beta-lactamase superfamily)